MIIASSPVRALGTVTPKLPGDKSITHRAFLAACIADGDYKVHDPNPGEDCQASLAAAASLGVPVKKYDSHVELCGTRTKLAPPDKPLDLGNSGTGMRLITGILAAQPFSCELTGDRSLQTRPMERVLKPLRAMGARAESCRGTPPIKFRGGPLRAVDWSMEVPSAQVKSAVLFAGAQAPGTTTIRGCRGTRDHTERLLDAWGGHVEKDLDAVSVTGPLELTAGDIVVPRDPSAAAFYAVLPAIVPGCRVILEDVCLNPTRIGFLSVLERSGLEVHTSITSESPEPMGRVEVCGDQMLPFEIMPQEVPFLIDELPALAVAAAYAKGTSTITGARELVHKESNRLQAVHDGLRAIGVDCLLHEDGWTIHGMGTVAGGKVDPRGDHRIAMAFLIGGLGSKSGVAVSGVPAIETSDPFFLSQLEHLSP